MVVFGYFLSIVVSNTRDLESDGQIRLPKARCELLQGCPISNCCNAKLRATIFLTENRFIKNFAKTIDAGGPIDDFGSLLLSEEGGSSDGSFKPLFGEYIGGVTQPCCYLGEFKIVGERLWRYDNLAMVNYLSRRCEADVFKSELKDNKLVHVERRHVEDRTGNIGPQLPLGSFLSTSYEADGCPPEHQSNNREQPFTGFDAKDNFRSLLATVLVLLFAT